MNPDLTGFVLLALVIVALMLMGLWIYVRKLQIRAAAFLSWFEDNMAGEQWLDPDALETDPDYKAGYGGAWRDYTELPEYIRLRRLV
jgi:hypothetical protein